MNQLHWIKLSTDLFGNPKIRCLLADPEGQSTVLLWVFLLTAAGRTNDGGRLGLTDTLPYTPETLSVQTGIPAAQVRAGLERMTALDMLETDEAGFLRICGWTEHQVTEKQSPDADPEALRERSRIRKAKSRAARTDRVTEADAADRSDVTADVTETSVTCHTDVTLDVTPEPVTCHSDVTDASVTCHTDVTPDVTPEPVTCHSNVTASHSPYIDIDIERDKDTDTELLCAESGAPPGLSDKHKDKRFRPPSVSEVRDYCLDRGNQVDPKRFVDYYTANGWKVGRNKMSDWRAAVRTWERNEKNACAAGCPPGAVMGPTGVPILVPAADDLAGIL